MAKRIEDVLWRAADKLRGVVDAAQYKEFVLGLVFLKYVADGAAFEVPDEARWESVAAAPDGARIDAAMGAVMRADPALAGTLPQIFGRVDRGRLAELVALIGSIEFPGERARDMLGEVYEYFLEKFARAEGKRAGEFYTPAGVVKLLVEVLEPYSGRVYDPCCGSGGMFVQAAKFVGGDHERITVHGQEANERTWRLAKMNLAIHGMDPRGLGDRWADTFADELDPGLRADFVLANPPFNMSDWARRDDDPRWGYGIPPRGNANFAWLQHIAARLSDRGTAGVVLANGSMSAKQSGEGAIRAALVEDDLVSCMVALPPNLFRTTAIPACLWFLDRDKSGRGKWPDRRGEILFIDARRLGTMVDRTERVLTDDDITRVADTYHSWRGTKPQPYADEPGFCVSATIQQVAAHDHVLTPGQFVGSAPSDDDAEPVTDRIARLTKDLFVQFEETSRLEAVVREQLGRLDG